MDEARVLVKELMQLDSDHEVLFYMAVQATQFIQVPMNLLDDKDVPHMRIPVYGQQKPLKKQNFWKPGNCLQR